MTGALESVRRTADGQTRACMRTPGRVTLNLKIHWSRNAPMTRNAIATERVNLLGKEPAFAPRLDGSSRSLERCVGLNE